MLMSNNNNNYYHVQFNSHSLKY